MQTFLPYPDYERSARSLDDKRLGKQRVEAKQILNALDGVSKGWTNHPATRMWRGHEAELCQYAIAICNEWRRRGFNDSLLPEFATRIMRYPLTGTPAWFGDPDFHVAHQSNLVRKDPTFYTWPVPDDLPYIWPV